MMADDEDFDERLDNAIKIAECYSGFTKFAASYPPLFKRLWREQDPQEVGHISAAQAELIARAMVQAGWADWAPTERDRTLWAELERVWGHITLEQFAEMSENKSFEVSTTQEAAQADVAAPSKREAAAAMGQAHANRMDSFVLPDAKAAASTRSAQHCTDCEGESTMQHAYAGARRYCPEGSLHQILDYQCMCGSCAQKQQRCCGCGKKLQ
jgi:hypothetical protein